jgi:hypothetical protein
MLQALNFVRGAVDEKGVLPVLTHVHCEGGTLQAFNGRVALEAPVDSLTDAGKVRVSKGKFRALIAQATGFPRQEFIEPQTASPAGLLPALQTLRTFISHDASRIWSLSVLLSHGWAYATNNVVLARVPLPFEGEANIPVYALDELLRIGEPPLGVEFHDGIMHVSWPNGRRMRSNTVDGGWPDVAHMMAKAADMQPIPRQLQEVCATVAGLVEDSKVPILLLDPDSISTGEGEHTAEFEMGARIEGRYDYRMLRLVLEQADAWGRVDDRMLAFEGPQGLEGIFVGMNT